MKQIFIFFIVLIMSGNLISQSISLDGDWNFAADSNGYKLPEETSSLFWRSITVPSSWQASFDDLRDYQGVGWYKKTVDINKLQKDKIYLLKFNAVDFLTEVWFNGSNLGKHEGGYTPFYFDITNLVKESNNEIILRIVDPVYDSPGTEGIEYQNIPHGKQSWYVQTSGIWQSASVEIKPQIYFTRIHITPSNSGIVNVKCRLNTPLKEDQQININISSPDNKEAAASVFTFIKGDESSFNLNIKDPELWSPSSPKLYTLTIRLNGEERTEKFGFRSFEARDGMLYLNGEPYYMIAALDQDFYPESIYTTPSEEYIRDEMIKAKQLGLNMLRCHIKVPDPIYLKVADEVGLLVWYEVPNWINFNSTSARLGETTMDAMLDRDWNHPSLVILSIINESWGIDLSKKEQREWLAGEYDRVKKMAEGRLVVDNSACWGNFHVKTDINDYHTYWAIPENRQNFDNTVKEFASRPDWLFSKDGDSQETGKEPLILSEFGNWGLPKLDGNDPWWFRNNFIDNGLVLPLGYDKRFAEYKYNEIFENYNDLAENSQHAQFQALKYEIEQIRLHPEIQGYVITEFTDLNWECNGLLDMWRNFKVYKDELFNIQQEDLIIPRPVKYNYLVNEKAEIKLYLSHYSSMNIDNASIKWSSSTGESGTIKVPSIKRTGVKEIESVLFTIPADAAGTIRINFELLVDNKIVSKNYTEIYAYPEVQKLDNMSFALDHNLDRSGFSKKLNIPTARDAKFLITNHIDKNIQSAVKEGSLLICLVDTNTVFPEDLSVKVIPRTKEWYDGNWASNLNWRRNHTIFNNINKNKYFGFEIAQSVPRLVLGNIPAESFSDVIAGMYGGWIQINSAYIYRMNYGKGEILFCTFPVADNYADDPFARTLLHNMITFLSSAR